MKDKMLNIKRIGVLGGSFDPPHFGHLQMASKALEMFDIERILFVPCNHNPLKDINGFASAFHRYVMTQLATLVEERFLVTPLEINRKGKSYTIDTLMDLSKTGYELSLLMGMDAFLSVSQWKDYQKFPKYCDIIVFSRDEFLMNGIIPEEISKISKIVGGFDFDISSTEIRKKIRMGEPIDREVAPLVKVYIDKYELYRDFRDQNRLIDDPIKDYFTGCS